MSTIAHVQNRVAQLSRSLSYRALPRSPLTEEAEKLGAFVPTRIGIRKTSSTSNLQQNMGAPDPRKIALLTRLQRAPADPPNQVGSGTARGEPDHRTDYACSLTVIQRETDVHRKEKKELEEKIREEEEGSFGLSSRALQKAGVYTCRLFSFAGGIGTVIANQRRDEDNGTHRAEIFELCCVASVLFFNALANKLNGKLGEGRRDQEALRRVDEHLERLAQARAEVENIKENTAVGVDVLMRFAQTNAFDNNSI